MKMHEVKGQQQLDELTFRQALATGVAGASLMGAPHKATAPEAPARTYAVQPAKQAELEPVQVTAKKELTAKMQRAVDVVSQRYDADPELVKLVFELAQKYQKPGFPTAKDLLAIIAVESEFDPEAVSGLKNDPAVGLTQVRPKVWGLDPESLKDPETAVKVGAEILHKYYRHLKGDKEGAVQAYNVGMTNYKQGTGSPNYLNKFLTRLKNLPI